jgi:hypothetical protein
MDEIVPDPSTALPALPLDSPDWVPLDTPYHWLTERFGNPELAAHDLHTALATPPPHGVRTLQRYLGRYRDPDRPELERELLDFSHWEKRRLISGRDGLCDGPPIRPGQSFAQYFPIFGVFAWKPDLARVWPMMFSANEAAASTTTSAPRSVLRQPTGPKTARSWQDHVLREIVRATCAGRPHPSASELAQSCLDDLNISVEPTAINKFLRDVDAGR